MKSVRSEFLLSSARVSALSCKRALFVGAALAVLVMQTSCRRAPAEPLAADVASRAEAYLRAQTEAGFFNGAVLIQRGDVRLYRGAFGWADVEQKTPNSVATRFRIASISKTFTAALVLKLAGQGLLDIQAPLENYFQPCPDAWRRLTVHQLLTHTTGIPNYTSLPSFEENNHAPLPPEEILAWLRDLPLEAEPGTEYRYSNSNYLLLALLAEQVGRRPLAELLREQLLTPHGLNDTGALGRGDDATFLATGYVPDGLALARARPFDLSWVAGSGSMYSTVDDLQKWVQALAGNRVLPAETREKMWRADKGAYGYGWQVLDRWPAAFGKPLVLHAGGMYGVATDLLYYPGEQLSIVILSNLETAPMAVIARDLSAIVFGAEYAMPKVRKAVPVDAAMLDAHTGVYQIAPGVALTVRRDGDRLKVQATGQPADIAIPESATRFFSRRVDAQLTFLQDAAGRTTGLVIHQSGKDTTAQRVD